MKPIVHFLAFCIALAVPVASHAGDLADNPLARGKVDLDPCKNHFILREPCGLTPNASWAATSDMHEARSGHTATLLNDGTVLVAGGGVASAELYDPRDHSWTLTGPLSHARVGHKALLLPSGKVLVLGGGMPGRGLPMVIDNSAEIYDPSTRQWTGVAGMQIPRQAYEAILLDTGKVLVVGGVDADDRTVLAAELYDPQTDSWDFTGNSTVAFWHTMTKLRDGRVLIAGGVLDDWLAEPINSAELYDPASGTFAPTGAMFYERAEHVASLLDDGSVLVSGGFIKGYPSDGGYCGFGSITYTERYDPRGGNWLPAGIQNVARMSHTATLLDDGTVLLTGGDQSTGSCPNITWSTIANSEVSGPDSSSWTHVMPTMFPRANHTATLLPDGSVLVAGGRQSPNYGTGVQALKSAELYGASSSQ
jgi:hypothetical protein